MAKSRQKRRGDGRNLTGRQTSKMFGVAYPRHQQGAAGSETGRGPQT
jgi:hypothetical protein